MKRKSKIVIVSLTSCEGCQFALLDFGKKFFDFLKKVSLLDLALVEEKPFPMGKIDVAFIEGNPITKEDVKFLKKIREKAKILVALGNCAALGGIPEMKNYQEKEKTVRFIYKRLKDVANPEIKEIDNFVKVDFAIPGCPINAKEFLKLADELIKGRIPKILQKAVCSECLFLGKKSCFLKRKEFCLGPIILAGCEGVCPKNEFPCYGCRGPKQGGNVKVFLETLSKMKSKKEVDDVLEIFGLKDML